MIFAAGLGTRLYPLTKDKPKALAPIGDMTLLEYNLKYLNSQGVDGFIINTHHFASKIEEYLSKNNNFNLDITISYEKELLDTGGGLAKVREMIDEDQILIYNVDIISDIDIRKLVEYHKTKNSDITLVTRNRQTSRYLLFDEKNQMTGWKNEKTGEIKLCNKDKEYQKSAFSGISIINTNLLEHLGKVEKKSIIDFYLKLCSDHNITTYKHDNDYWFDCGSLEKLEVAEKYYKTQK